MDHLHERSTFVVQSQAELCSRRRILDGTLKPLNTRVAKSDVDSVMVDSQLKELSTESDDDKSSGSR